MVREEDRVHDGLHQQDVESRPCAHTYGLWRGEHPGHGTGKRARLDGFTVAGKTGTAEIAVNGRYLPKYFTSSFAGFVPAERPVFTLLVTLKGVNKHGGTVCGPVFKAIAERTLEHLSIQPEQPAALDSAVLDLDLDRNLNLQLQ